MAGMTVANEMTLFNVKKAFGILDDADKPPEQAAGGGYAEKSMLFGVDTSDLLDISRLCGMLDQFGSIVEDLTSRVDMMESLTRAAPKIDFHAIQVRDPDAIEAETSEALLSITDALGPVEISDEQIATMMDMERAVLETLTDRVSFAVDRKKRGQLMSIQAAADEKELELLKEQITSQTTEVEQGRKTGGEAAVLAQQLAKELNVKIERYAQLQQAPMEQFSALWRWIGSIERDHGDSRTARDTLEAEMKVTEGLQKHVNRAMSDAKVEQLNDQQAAADARRQHAESAQQGSLVSRAREAVAATWVLSHELLHDRAMLCAKVQGSLAQNLMLLGCSVPAQWFWCKEQLRKVVSTMRTLGLDEDLPLALEKGIRIEDNVHSAQKIVGCSIKALSAVSKRHYLDQFCESYAKARTKMAANAQKLANAESERQRVASIQKQINEIHAVKESRKADMGDLDVGTTRELDKVDCRLIELEEMQHGLALAFAEPDAVGGGVNVPTAAGIGNKMAHFGEQVAAMSKTLEMVLANQDTLLSRMSNADHQWAKQEQSLKEHKTTMQDVLDMHKKSELFFVRREDLSSIFEIMRAELSGEPQAHREQHAHEIIERAKCQSDLMLAKAKERHENAQVAQKPKMMAEAEKQLLMATDRAASVVQQATEKATKHIRVRELSPIENKFPELGPMCCHLSRVSAAIPKMDQLSIVLDEMRSAQLGSAEAIKDELDELVRAPVEQAELALEEACSTLVDGDVPVPWLAQAQMKAQMSSVGGVGEKLGAALSQVLREKRQAKGGGEQDSTSQSKIQRAVQKAKLVSAMSKMSNTVTQLGDAQRQARSIQQKIQAIAEASVIQSSQDSKLPQSCAALQTDLDALVLRAQELSDAASSTVQQNLESEWSIAWEELESATISHAEKQEVTVEEIGNVKEQLERTRHEDETRTSEMMTALQTQLEMSEKLFLHERATVQRLNDNLEDLTTSLAGKVSLDEFKDGMEQQSEKQLDMMLKELRESSESQELREVIRRVSAEADDAVANTRNDFAADLHKLRSVLANQLAKIELNLDDCMTSSLGSTVTSNCIACSRPVQCQTYTPRAPLTEQPLRSPAVSRPGTGTSSAVSRPRTSGRMFSRPEKSEHPSAWGFEKGNEPVSPAVLNQYDEGSQHTSTLPDITQRRPSPVSEQDEQMETQETIAKRQSQMVESLQKQVAQVHQEEMEHQAQIANKIQDRVEGAVAKDVVSHQLELMKADSSQKLAEMRSRPQTAEERSEAPSSSNATESVENTLSAAS